MPAAALRSVLLLATLSLAVPALAAPAAAPAPAPIAIRGLVVEGADDRPVAGARVTLLAVQGPFEEAAGWLAGTPPEPLARAVTDDQGRFELQAPGTGIWRVAVEAPGRMPMELVVAPLLDAVELPGARLVPDLGLEVQVRDAAGRPAAARLAAFQPVLGDGGPALLRGRSERGWQVPARRAVAGADGRARLPRARGERLRLIAAAPGGAPVRLLAGSGPRLEVTLPAGVPRAVQVLDEAGRPAAGAVAVDDSGLLALGQADAEGRWTAHLPPAPQPAPARAGTAPAGGLTLLWHGAGGRRGSLAVAAAPAERPATVRLDLPAAVTGRVVDRPGRRPVAGALVWFPGAPEGLVRTGADGRYSVRPPAPCLAPLRAAAPGYLLPADFGAGGCTPPGPVFALEPAAAVEGVVVDGAGRPVAGARVAAAADREVLSPLQRLAGPDASLRTRTWADGRFRLALLLPGQAYRLDVELAGLAPAELEVAPLAAAEVRRGLRVTLGNGRPGIGRVVDAGGRPVAGARVRLQRAREPERGIWRRPADWRAVTGPDGRFEVAGLLPGRYELQAAAPGFAVSEVPGIEVADGEGAGKEKAGAAALGTVVLRPGVAIAGQVVDRDGAPLAGAEVDAAGRRRPDASREDAVLATDAEGRFTVGDLVPGESVTLRVSKAGYATRTVSNAVAPTAVRVVLAPAARPSGRVLDPDRRAVEGAQVFAGSDAIGFAVSDAGGNFLLEGLEGGPLELGVVAAGFVPYRLAGVEVPAGGERAGLELVLEPGATLEGRVLGPDGQPAAGAVLRLRDLEAGFGQADGEGAFRLAGVPVGPRVVVAEHPAYPALHRDLDVRPGVNPVTLTFEAGGELAGRVVDRDGLPLAGARVTLFPGEPDGGRPDLRSATSGADGAFAFPGLRPGSYHARAERQGYVQDRSAREDLQVAAGRRTEVEIRLEPSAAVLRGRLLGLAPADLAGVRVRAMGPDFRVGRVDPQGGYLVEGVTPGEWRVEATLRFSGREAEGRVTLPEGAAEATLDLDFAGGLTLSGVATRDGQPVQGMVTLIAVGGPFGVRSAQLRADGGFELTGLAPGKYQLQVRAYPERSTLHSEEIELDADRTLRIELASVRVSGRVLDAADGGPIAGAAVRLEPAEPAAEPPLDGLASTESDSLGAFHLQGKEGSFRLVASRDGYAPGETALELQGGSPVAEVELRLQATEGVSFEVQLAAGAVPQQVRVALLGADGRTVLAEEMATTQGGRVRAATAPAGSWELLVASGDSATVRLPVNVPGTLGRLVLPPSGRLLVSVPALTGAAALQVTDAATGRPAPVLDWDARPVASWTLEAGKGVAFGLAPGAYRLTVTAADGRTWTGGATVVAGADAEVTLP